MPRQPEVRVTILDGRVRVRVRARARVRVRVMDDGVDLAAPA